MITEHIGFEWCLPPDGVLNERQYWKPSADAFREADLVAINTTAGWLVLVRHFQSETGTTYSEYVRPSELRQKP